MILGVTGGIGSGKSAVCARLASAYGIPYIDADDEARRAVMPGSAAHEAILANYPQAQAPDGTLDRRWLRNNVLVNTAGKQWLESLIHPVVRENIRHWLAATEPAHPYVVLASPLLFETGQSELCDLTLVVDVTQAQQLERAARRDQQNEEQIRRIMAAQLERSERLALADRVLDNTGDPVALEQQVAILHRDLLERARERQEGRHDI